MPEDLVGSQIIEIGAPADLDVEGGGLGITYKTKTGELKQVIFAFCETGMWIHDT